MRVKCVDCVDFYATWRRCSYSGATTNTTKVRQSSNTHSLTYTHTHPRWDRIRSRNALRADRRMMGVAHACEEWRALIWWRSASAAFNVCGPACSRVRRLLMWRSAVVKTACMCELRPVLYSGTTVESEKKPRSRSQKIRAENLGIYCCIRGEPCSSLPGRCNATGCEMVMWCSLGSAHISVCAHIFDLSRCMLLSTNARGGTIGEKMFVRSFTSICWRTTRKMARVRNVRGAFFICFSAEDKGFFKFQIFNFIS